MLKTKTRIGVAVLFAVLVVMTSFALAQVNTGGNARTSDHNRQVIGYITQWDAWKTTTAGVPMQGALTHLNIDYSKHRLFLFLFFSSFFLILINI